jgi:hypothetical protein
MKTTKKAIIAIIILIMMVSTLSAQTITSISPTSGSLTGNTVVTIKGTGFTTKPTVLFGAVGVPLNDIKVVSNTKIIVKSPAVSSPKSVKVTVIVNGNSATAPKFFEYKLPEITSISPDSSSVKGNEIITIKGNYLSGATYVKFDQAGNPPLTVNDTIITVKNPPHISGKVGVRVQVQGVYSNINDNSKFIYSSNVPKGLYSISLKDSTGLSKKYKVYVLGYTTNSQKMLTVNPVTLEGEFTTITSKKGYIESYELGKEITSIKVSNQNPIVGARIFFFIADTSKTYNDNASKTSNRNLGFPFSESGASVLQVDNPPQTDFPPYSYIEATFEANQGLYLDVSTVDGFFFPLSIIAEDNNGVELDRIGQSKGITAAGVANAYKPFMKNVKADKDYDSLYYVVNSDVAALLNPGLYLENNTSALETVFDEALNKLFTDATLKMNIWQNGDNKFQAYYDVKPVLKTFPNTSNTHEALEFTSAGATTLHVFNPVGFSVVSYFDSTSNTRKPIMGSIAKETLLFETPLPLDTGLTVGMYVCSGGGSTDGKTQITKINKVQNKIVSVNLSSSKDYASTFQYKFAKAPTNYYYSSGQMTFAGIGLFADGPFRYPNDKNLQIVVNGLENQISTALNRGVAVKTFTDTSSKGHTTKNWEVETNWYPSGEPQNLFSYFMHTAKVNGINIFSLPKNSVQSARGDVMAKAYGFAYDENPVGNSNQVQPQVPSEFPGAYPKGTTKLKLVLGAWK